MSKCTNEASSSEIHFESSFKNEAVANFQKLLLQDLDFVEDSFEAVKNKASQVIVEVNQARNEFEELMMLPEGRTEERDFKLHQLKKKVSKLKFAIPFSLIAPSEQPHPNIKWHRPELDLYQVKDRSYPNMNYGGNYYYNDDDDDGSPNAMYSDLKSAIWRLNLQQRWLLSCLLLFPKNLYIKRSIIFCWVKAISMTGFNFITHAIDELIERRLILAVYKKSNLAAAGYKIHPFVHSTLISNTSWHTGCSPRDMYLGHSVAVEEEDIYYTTQSFEDSVPTNNTRILYLGRWNMSTQQHIEVINPKLFFKEMSKLARLTFVSLRGISMIEELPEFITTLKWLKTLDLKACHNLEVIPSSISNLRHSLVRLDISECYLLEHIPKALATLVKLKVLKGFLVGENKERSCTLEDLVNLQQLEKLNVYTSMEGFPNKSQFTTLQNFGKLHSLTISWGGCSVLTGPAESRKEDKYDDSKSKYTEEHPSHKENRLTEVESSKTAGAPLKKLLTLKENIDGEQGTLSFSIEKLDLQCVPETVTCRWLKPTNFKNLKKLYIRGGKFFDLGRLLEEHQWSVEILRLKHLSKLKIDWDELQRLFPKLICLEKNLLSLTICWERGYVLNQQPKSSQVKRHDELKSKNVKEDPASKEDELLQVKSGEQIRAPLEKPLALKEQIHGDHGTFSFSIEKLDLQCVPEAGTRRWLKPINFGNLKKLYIRGRQFCNFGQSSKENQWNVEILRLKHLSKVSMNWSELQRFFPNLIFLEKVNCPNINQFPCNDRGIRINNGQC